MSEIDQVLETAKRIYLSGKAPTTALLKAKLGKTVAMPSLIQGLQRFKSLSEQEIEQIHSAQPEQEDIQTKVAEPLEQQVGRLQIQIEQLQATQSELIKRLEKLESSSNKIHLHHL